MKTLLLLSLGLAACHADAQVPPRAHDLPPIDVQDYDFRVFISDTTDHIRVVATVALVPSEAAPSFWLDLVGIQPDGTGMQVADVYEAQGPEHTPIALIRPLRHEQNRLTITPNEPLVAGERRTFVITYAGIPGDGLIISTNTHGDRTFFGDNWPERARHWLPVVDHPSDKATVTWTVDAPVRVRVVANGRRGVQRCEGTRCTTTYYTRVPIPTKVMVFGAAPFAVEEAGRVGGVPIESWVYAQDREAGFYDYALAVPITTFFDSLLTPFPFEKLANVQSKTRYGGMENAGAIFYNEGSVRGDRGAENLLAHEIAHQWFGDHVTEADWPHLWLSEGFATYLTNVYVEKTKGAAQAEAMRREQRATVLGYYEENRDPLIDTTYADPNELLNANPYQRGAWVLHMLRRHLARTGEGDAVFFEGLRRYVETHGGGNATTDDFQHAMESVTGNRSTRFSSSGRAARGSPFSVPSGVQRRAQQKSPSGRCSRVKRSRFRSTLGSSLPKAIRSSRRWT